MMDRTDRHYRRFIREITRRTLLYTEMVTTDAIRQGNPDALLGFDPAERPLALQLGGDDPMALAECARIAEDRGYDEVNLNVGCPSDRVRQGRFGACLMAEPDRVAAAVAAMRAATALPVTVKHRIGIDDLDRYEDMERFVSVVAGSGCDRFSVHARKAVLGGLTPKENRSVPPLRYEEVHRLKSEHPELRIEINGGIRSLAEVREQLAFVDGVMIGRAAYDDPFFLSGADREFYGEPDVPRTRRQVVEALVPYIEARLAKGVPLGRITRHMHGLFTGRAGARRWRRQLSENTNRPGAGVRVLLDSIP
jgi:tRNA-dihydrouridine synthase A